MSRSCVGCLYYRIEPEDNNEWRRCTVPIELQGEFRYPMPCVSILVGRDSNEMPCSGYKPNVNCYTASEYQMDIWQV